MDPSMSTTLEAIPKTAFGPISALDAYIKSSKYLMYFSGMIFAVAGGLCLSSAHMTIVPYLRKFFSLWIK